MKLYLISQSTNRGYDAYDSAVVCAPDEYTACCMHPADGTTLKSVPDYVKDWVTNASLVSVTYIGMADGINSRQRVICASFNAG